MTGCRAALIFVLAATAGCITAPHEVRSLEAEWRQRLSSEAPPGASREKADRLLRDHGLVPSTGTYRVAHADGRETSSCRLPDRALSATQPGAVRGLYIKWDLEITVCLDEKDTVEGHFVGA